MSTVCVKDIWRKKLKRKCKVPIFEHDEEITDNELKRQQDELNNKIFRKSFTRMVGDFERNFFGGDCWRAEYRKLQFNE